MKSKRNFLKAIVKGIVSFAALLGILAVGATFGVLVVFQVSRTPGLVFAGAVGLALLYFGIKAAIRAYKPRMQDGLGEAIYRSSSQTLHSRP
jgi:hypothetical protein